MVQPDENELISPLGSCVGRHPKEKYSSCGQASRHPLFSFLIPISDLGPIVAGTPTVWTSAVYHWECKHHASVVLSFTEDGINDGAFFNLFCSGWAFLHLFTHWLLWQRFLHPLFTEKMWAIQVMVKVILTKETLKPRGGLRKFPRYIVGELFC